MLSLCWEFTRKRVKICLYFSGRIKLVVAVENNSTRRKGKGFVFSDV